MSQEKDPGVTSPSKGEPAPDRRAGDESFARAEPGPRQPTSQVLDELLRGAAADTVTLEWLFTSLRDRSFGIIVLLLAIVGMLPTVGTFTGLLLLVPATQMILARPVPVLPGLIMSRRLPTQRVARLVRLATRLTRWCERFSYPRWTTPTEITQRIVGIVVLLLAISLLSPLPFSQVIPNFVLILIAFSLLAADGLLLSVALLLAFVSIGITGASIWGTVVAASFL